MNERSLLSPGLYNPDVNGTILNEILEAGFCLKDLSFPLCGQFICMPVCVLIRGKKYWL